MTTEHDYAAALEWFDARQKVSQGKIEEFCVKHPDQIRHKDAIRHALKIAEKLMGEPDYDSRPDGTGLDDGPPLPRNVFVQGMKPLGLRALKQGLSARAVARICQVSHETAANWAKEIA